MSETNVLPEQDAILRMVAGRDTSGKALEELGGYSSTVVIQAFHNGKPIVVTGTDQGKAMGSESAVLHNLRSIMAVPLKVREKTIGVVYLDSHLAKGLFTNEDLDLLSAISNYIAIAFESSRMARVEIERANLQKELEIQMAIAAESKKVKIMVDNMQQALFSVDASGRVVEPVSRYSEAVLGGAVANQNVLSVLFKDISGEKLDGIRSALGTVFGEDELQWSLMEDNFPSKINLSVPRGESTGGSDRVLKVRSSPIWDDQELLEKILFVVEDITSLEVLEKQVSENRRRALILDDILNSKPEELRRFLTGALITVQNLKERASDSASLQIAPILRDLHTLKGNARLYKSLQLSERVHQSESVLVEIQNSSADQNKFVSVVQEELTKVENVISEYVGPLEKIRPGAGATENLSVINKEALDQLQEKVKLLEQEFGDDKISELKACVRKLSLKSVRDLIRQFDPMIQDVAKQLEKSVRLEIRGDAFVNETQFAALQECFLHLIRNSVDHGIEPASERSLKNKPPTGTITVDCAELDDVTTISIGDDGRGMDEEVIVKKAVQKNIVSEGQAMKMSRNEKINLIFAPGFSTKDAASDISGRGIGMDVIKQNIVNLNGDLKMETHLNKGSRFTITISMRARC